MPIQTYVPSEYRENRTADSVKFRMLWLKVIAVAVADAEGPRGWPRTQEAREWLAVDSDDLRRVCMLAQVDVGKLLLRYGRVYGGGSKRD